MAFWIYITVFSVYGVCDCGGRTIPQTLAGVFVSFNDIMSLGLSEVYESMRLWFEILGSVDIFGLIGCIGDGMARYVG